ncbi:MAG: NADP-dependent oxidoreductase [Pseudomonadota bacterium]
MTINRQWLINANPRGRALTIEDFKYHEETLQALTSDEVRVKTTTLGFDPSQKGQMENVSGYASGNNVGDLMVGRGIGEVIESSHPRFPVGSIVTGPLGWQEYASVKPRLLELIEDEDIAPSAYLGPLGSTGLTAYFGLLRVGQPEPGDEVVISGAAGGVGSITGQIANLVGCHTTGIAGGSKKCDWLVNNVGFNHAIDYKSEHVKSRLRELVPSGINIFFDNVGGDILNDALACIAPHARVVVCGGISRYEQATLPQGPANYFNIVFRQARMEGFLLTAYSAEFAEARRRLKTWIANGDITYKEDVQEGFENIPKTLLRLFSGANFGKQILNL